jgi:hypothetical protein
MKGAFWRLHNSCKRGISPKATKMEEPNYWYLDQVKKVIEEEFRMISENPVV